MDYNKKRFTVAELPEYLKQARRLLDEQERQDTVQYLAEHPRAGDLMLGTGGFANCVGGGNRRANPVGCGSLLRAQRAHALVPADHLWKKRTRQPQPGRTQRTLSAGWVADPAMAGRLKDCKHGKSI